MTVDARRAAGYSFVPMDAPFLGFIGTMEFLRDLARHNDRDWFNSHKATYERVYKRPAEAFVAEIRPRLEALAGEPLGAKIFRIHRDVRFSKDKRPYNSHLHIGLQPLRTPGEPRRRGGFYVGVEPDKLMLGVGAFDFGPADLDRYRKAVAGERDGPELAELLRSLEARQHDPDLKRVPAPWAADHPRGELLRRKGLNVWRDIEDPALVASPELADVIVADFERLDPVNVWLTDVLGG